MHGEWHIFYICYKKYRTHHVTACNSHQLHNIVFKKFGNYNFQRLKSEKNIDFRECQNKTSLNEKD